MNNQKLQIIEQLYTIIKNNNLTIKFQFGVKSYYVKFNYWYKGTGIQYEIFDAKFGTNTYPTTHIILKDYEINMNDIDTTVATLYIRITNELRKIR